MRVENTIFYYVTLKQLRWYSYMKKMQEDRLPKMYLNGNPKDNGREDDLQLGRQYRNSDV